MRRVRACLVAGLLAAAAPAALEAAQDPPRIADNSFLVEEAYNQEPGVVQHISTLWASGPGRRSLLYALTQEWPVLGQRHQLSYTVPVNFGDGQGGGMGDLVLTYRLQVGLGADVAAAPRVTFALQTGDWRRGYGAGSPGVQVALPVSARLSRQLVVHANGGVMLSPAMRSTSGTRRTVATWSGAASVVGPVLLPANAMLEVLAQSSASVSAAGAVEHEVDVIVSPGFRAAFEVGGVQVVPGVAVPLYLRGGSERHDLFFYLSLEHGFRATREDAR